MDKDDDSITIDFTKIKNMFKPKGKNEVNKLSSEIGEVEDDLNETIKEEHDDSRLKEDKIKLDNIKNSIKKESQKIDTLNYKKDKIEEAQEKENEILYEQESKLDKIEEDIKESKSDDDFKLDIKEHFNSVIFFFKNNKYALPVLLIFIAIFFSTFFRMYPSDLPITDQWAEENVRSEEHTSELQSH